MIKTADPHIHGGWGFSFQRGEFGPLEEKLRNIGVVFAIPTLMNASLRELGRTGEAFLRYRAKNPDSIFPFLRVEGPFISLEKSGAQPREFILPATEKNIREFLSLPGIEMFTFAPEIPGAEDLINMALERGKIPSIGHTNATYPDILRAYQMGVRHFTHFPNAMRGMHHREIGALGAGFLLEEVHLEVIADFFHLSKEFLRIILKIKGPEFSLISDMIPQGPSDSPLLDPQGNLKGGGVPVVLQAEKMKSLGLSQRELEKLSLLNALSFFQSRKS